jgi:hypothetical protein
MTWAVSCAINQFPVPSSVPPAQAGRWRLENIY